MTQYRRIKETAKHLLASRRPPGVEAQCLPQLPFVYRYTALP
jgi:hypothetical protein